MFLFYATRDGHSRRIAERIAERLAERAISLRRYGLPSAVSLPGLRAVKFTEASTSGGGRSQAR